MGATGIGEMLWGYFYVAESITHDCVKRLLYWLFRIIFFSFPPDLIYYAEGNKVQNFVF